MSCFNQKVLDRETTWMLLTGGSEKGNFSTNFLLHFYKLHSFV